MPTKSTKKKLQNNSGTSNKSLKKNYRNKKGGGSINDMYSSDDYKDAGTLDALKFRKIKKNNSNEREITAIGYVIRLLQGELKNEFGIPIKAVVLQGENNAQLSEIVKRHMLKTGKPLRN